MNHDIEFMKEAIRLSRMAVEHGNEPFGAVLVKDGVKVCSNENQIFTQHDYTCHAEIGLIRRYCSEAGISDLSEYTLYSSCEPCFMCSGALVWSRLGRLVYGASDLDLGEILHSKGSECSRIVFEHSHSGPQVTPHILREESLEVLRKYFSRREKN